MGMTIDELIAYHASELDHLRLLKSILESGDCNTCACSKGCTEVPKLGELVRYNCYAYVERVEDEKID